jgi:poly-gamma-glutamate synthesis protein (capsule biosynthesis protein)
MKKKQVVLGAVGDIGLWGASAKAVQENGALWPFEPMLPHLRKADLLFGNMESITLPADYPDGQIDPSGLVHRSDITPELKQAGFDVMCLANNHVLDGGYVGMFHTRDLIEKQGIAALGVGQTQAEARSLRVMEAGGLRFGFLCYCEDTNYSLGTKGPCHAYYAREAVLEDVVANRGKVDVLVVSIHADLEFMETPSLPRREIFREVARAGATVVLGHHPHVPQGVERIGKSLIAYSLGNFYFPAHSSKYMKDNGPHTAHSFLLLAKVGKVGVESFTRVPFVIAPPPNERAIPLAGSEKESMLAYFGELDRMVLDDEAVRRNWRQIAMRHLKLYLERAKTLLPEDMLQDTLGRLLLVAENRSWVEEAFQVVRENWARQAEVVDPLHRPHYVLTQRKKASSTA